MKLLSTRLALFILAAGLIGSASCLTASTAFAGAKLAISAGDIKAADFDSNAASYKVTGTEIPAEKGVEFSVDNIKISFSGPNTTRSDSTKIYKPYVYMRITNLSLGMTPTKWIEVAEIKDPVCSLSADKKNFSCKFQTAKFAFLMKIEFLVVSMSKSKVTDTDLDGDGVPDSTDKCKSLFGLPEDSGCPNDAHLISQWAHSPSFVMTNDSDDDGVTDEKDNCVDLANPDQKDSDGTKDSDGRLQGDACPKKTETPAVDCTADPKAKGCPAAVDCTANPEAEGCAPAKDTDGDSVPDSIDKCPNEPAATADGCPADQSGASNDSSNQTADSDGDKVPDATDNCPLVPNPKQEDADGDGIGDACQGDIFTPNSNKSPDANASNGADDGGSCSMMGPAAANPMVFILLASALLPIGILRRK